MKTVHVLWTGGWDSSYRVLDLSLVRGDNVQPHYLIDPKRESTEFERNAINRIRTEAVARGASIEEVEVHQIDSLEISRDAAAKHAVLRDRYGIGAQYLWLSEYARRREIDELELCIHRDDRAASVPECARLSKEAWAQAGEYGYEPPETLLSVFAFPIQDLTKRRMGGLAHKNGFHDLMARTWFCHRPTRGGTPCGFCNPCRWTRAEGAAERLSLAANMRDTLDRRFVSYIPGFRVKRRLRSMMRGWW